MIQRIQTLYLVITLGLTVLILFIPFASVHTDILYLFDSFGLTHFESTKLVTDMNTLPIALLVFLILIFTIIDIFLFKKRTLQARLARITLFLQVGIYVLIAFYTYFVARSDISANISWNYPIALPLINIILLALSIRGIRKDDALIRSVDRIR